MDSLSTATTSLSSSTSTAVDFYEQINAVYDQAGSLNLFSSYFVAPTRDSVGVYVRGNVYVRELGIVTNEYNPVVQSSAQAVGNGRYIDTGDTLWGYSPDELYIDNGSVKTTLDGDSASHSNPAWWLEGGSNADSLIGSSLNDTLNGGDGNDIGYGNAGNDSIIGGFGIDTFYGGADNDSISGGSGDDLLFGDTGNDTIDGGFDNDSISGGSGDDSLLGDAANDTIDGGADNDSISGGSGDDLLFGDTGNDTIDGGTGNDTIDGGFDGDTINGGADNDSISGGGGADSLLGDAGDDTIDGGSDNDTIDGGSNDDSLLGDTGSDFIDGGDGNDQIDGGSDSDTLFGVDGNDLMFGGSGSDSIIGGIGQDTIFGQSENDTDTTNAVDTLTGEFDRDMFSLADLNQNDNAYRGTASFVLGVSNLTSGAYITDWGFGNQADQITLYNYGQIDGAGGFNWAIRRDGATNNLLFEFTDGTTATTYYQLNYAALETTDQAVLSRQDGNVISVITVSDSYGGSTAGKLVGLENISNWSFT